jgi:hypothetical protein
MDSNLSDRFATANASRQQRAAPHSALSAARAAAIVYRDHSIALIIAAVTSRAGPV